MTGSTSWIELDLLAGREKRNTYKDPKTGYSVFSTYGLMQREDCCGCGCRHCPFGHVEVSSDKRPQLELNPWLENMNPDNTECDLLSWSGGKDSFLALQAMLQESDRPVVLMTTFDGRTEKVAHQEVTLSMIRSQAQALNVPLLLVPLYPQYPYLTRIEQGLSLLTQRILIHRFAFGDLHLQHVRDWREKELKSLTERFALSLHFPIWNVDYSQLMKRLEQAPVQCHLSAVSDDRCTQAVSVGDVFDRGLIESLPTGVDPLGENGEFHTYVSIGGKLDR